MEGFPWRLSGLKKNPPASAEDSDLLFGSGRSPEKEKATYKSCGQRSLVGYRPWGHK